MFDTKLVEIEIPDDHTLIGAATIAIDHEGQVSLRFANVVDASPQLTPSQQAHYLRVLATGVEAEAIAAESTTDTD